MQKRSFIGVLLAGILLICITGGTMAAPDLINYQGMIKTSAGVPLAGTVTLQFSLYNAPSDGTMVWGEVQNTVQVTNGIYNVLLGSGTLLPGSPPLTANLFSTANLWLQVTVGGEPLTPRQQLTSVPFALKASNADNATLLNGQLASAFGSAADLLATQTNITSLQTLLTSLNTTITTLQAQISADKAKPQKITNFHGTAMMLSSGAYKIAGKQLVKIAITSATAAEDGTLTVKFTVKDASDNTVKNVQNPAFSVAKLVPASGSESFSKWVAYINRAETVSGSASGNWPNPDGTMSNQGYYERNGTLTTHVDGSYTYVFATNLAAAVLPVGGTSISYGRGLTHRVAIMLGGQSGPTGDATFDFVPDGSDIVTTRNIVETGVCQECHGVEFSAHDGDRLSVGTCVTCHTPESSDAQSGESLDMKVMMHKLHAGGELASIAGPDGLVWDDSTTVTDESADNGVYAIWGDNNRKVEWWKSKFPALLGNCPKCHQGNGAEVNNWKNTPSRDACGSCHNTVNFATGTNHGGGGQATDTNCAVCHRTNGIALAPEGHMIVNDPRNTPEFTVNLSISQPANGSHFVAGESPVIMIAISENGSLLNHLTINEDSSPEGCLTTGCPPRDGTFRSADLFVHGPRALRIPVLTTKARVKIVSGTLGPFDLSAATASSLGLLLDGGEDLLVKVNGVDKTLAGTITVPVSSGIFANTAAVTTNEMVAWLNANAAFNARAIAYIEPDNKLAIRSRNLGQFASLQLQAGAVTTAVFSGDTAQKIIGGSTVPNSFMQRSNPANNDPKVSWFTDRITYTLDPVTDLKPGSYVASVQVSDRGRISATDYKTPSVATIAFQVGTATEEKPPAGNCNGCHLGPNGVGFIHDFSRRNNLLDATALDQCGACHDYQPQLATGKWSGTSALSKRVHAVHFGAKLNYPISTVGYGNGDSVPGRNWNITYTQDVRHCESCHADGTTSGTWKSNPSRMACSGCHDSDSATAHMNLQTYDPTPTNPWSGDEKESCKVCH